VVIGNFPAKGADRPSLLSLDFGGAIGGIVTLFHELGHAFHELLSATDLASHAGMNVPLDFIEMPSKMLEEFVRMPETLQEIGKHYLTGESIPESLVAKAVSLKSCFMAHLMLRYVNGGRFALDLFAEPTGKCIAALYEEIGDSLFPYIKDDEHLDHSYASIGHLVNMYFAKYYSYAWSSAFAYDIFAKIREEQLLGIDVGLRYRREILAAGGSLNPRELLKAFLGREPNMKAFFDTIGKDA
jgi:Zn-dependent oligopeptidase